MEFTTCSIKEPGFRTPGCISHFSVAMAQHHDQGRQCMEEKNLGGVLVPEGQEHIMVGIAWQERDRHDAWSSQTEQTASRRGLLLLKPAPSEVFPPARPHILHFVKQHQQLGTKCSNT